MNIIVIEKDKNMYSKGCFFCGHKFLYSQKRLRQPEFCICFENIDQLQTVGEQIKIVGGKMADNCD